MDMKDFDYDRDGNTGADEVQALLDSLLAEKDAGAAAPAEEPADEKASVSLHAAAAVRTGPRHAGSPEDNDLPLDAQPPAPKTRRNPLAAIGHTFADNVPHRGDGAGEWVRKCAFWISLAVLVVSLSYVLYSVWWQPAHNANVYRELEEKYDPTQSETLYEANYPQGMLASFRSLYDINPEVRGWLTYRSTGSRTFLDINYPVAYSGDNEKYLKTDFNGNRNKCGALFFDMRNIIEPENHDNKSLVIYGHNMASGQMFAGLNKLIGNLGNAKAASVMTLSTLFEEHNYKVFAVVLTDATETADWSFDCRRTSFSSDEDFLGYVEELRAHSLFNYPVDVEADDQLLVLSTCTSPSSSKLKDGRLAVIARRVREGESAEMNTAAISYNDDVIMPRAWYTAQDLPLHEYYNGNYPSGYQPTSSQTTSSPTFSADSSLPTGESSRTPDSSSTTVTRPGSTTKPGTSDISGTTSGSVTGTAPDTPTSSEPASTEPEPSHSESTSGEPEPTSSEPTSSEPEPTSTEPEPTPSEPEPTPTEPEPTPTEPEPESTAPITDEPAGE